MARVPLPHKGCFRASHPNSQWEEVACTTPPAGPYRRAPGPRPNHLGNKADYSAQIGGNLSSAEGTFDIAEGVTTVTDSFTGNTDTYMLQLNTEDSLKTAACAGSASGVCTGEEQFMYTNTQSSTEGKAFMQYWLVEFTLGRTKRCPQGCGSAR
jgi:hypothetical protein